MNGFLGADTEALRDMGGRVESRAELLDDMAARLAVLISGVDWIGPDAEGLRVDWSGRVQPSLVECGGRLREQGRGLHEQAEQQDQTSDPAAEGGAGDGSARADSAPDARFVAMPAPPRAQITLAAHASDLVAAHASETIGAAAEAPPPLMASAQDVSEAIGTDSPLAFDGTGLVLQPPSTSETITVDSDHDLAPEKASDPFGIDGDGNPIDLAASTKYEVGDHGTYYTDGDGQVVYVEATGGGKAMNPNLRQVFPDANYHVNDSVYYSTDELGRLDHMYVPEMELHPDTSRSQSIQSKIAERFDMSVDGDSQELEFNAGHAQARQFGGVREEINYTRQWDDVNQARSGVDDNIYAYESLMADGIEKHGHQYSYETRFNWSDQQPPGVGPDQGSEPWEYVPGSYDVRITENGEEIVSNNLPNYPDGATFDK